jgi:PIN domain nuclease of toxin-antitoxin system
MADEILLDTHALLWWQAGSDRLSAAANDAIAGADRVLVSPISCWEVAMLVTKGRVALDRAVARWVDDLGAGTVGFAELTPRVAAAAGSLEDFHGDPADRLIYATAADGRLPLVTKDRRLSDFARTDARVLTIW